MGFYTTTSVTEKPHPETPSCAQKTASGNFFTYPIKTQHKNRHNSLITNQEKPLSTHETASGVFYYKFRHYSAELGRWPSRDPIEERGGVNLYAFVGNEPIGMWDRLGLAITIQPIVEDNFLCCSRLLRLYNICSQRLARLEAETTLLADLWIKAEIIRKEAMWDLAASFTAWVGTGGSIGLMWKGLPNDLMKNQKFLKTVRGRAEKFRQKFRKMSKLQRIASQAALTASTMNLYRSLKKYQNAGHASDEALRKAINKRNEYRKAFATCKKVDDALTKCLELNYDGW